MRQKSPACGRAEDQQYNDCEEEGHGQHNRTGGGCQVLRVGGQPGGDAYLFIFMGISTLSIPDPLATATNRHNCV